jgi:hypothetical protein
VANNVAGLTTLITSDLTRTDISATQILYDIKSSIRDYEASRFFFNEKALAVTISATNTYALTLWGTVAAVGADVVEVDSLHATVNGITYPLDEVSYDEWRDLTSTTTLTGDPQKYAVFDQKVWLYPTPVTAGTATMAAHVKYAEVVSQSSSNVWTDAGRELIRCATLKRLWGRLIKDPEQAQMMQIAETQALAALQRRTDALSGHRVIGYL